MSLPMMGILQELAKDSVLAKKLEELNSNIRSLKWLSLFILIYAVDDGKLTVDEMIAAVIGMYLIMGIENLFSFLWFHFKVGFSRAWTKRNDQKKWEKGQKEAKAKVNTDAP